MKINTQKILKSLIFLIIIISKIISIEKKIITFPFLFKSIHYVSNYNSTNFINDYFKRDIIIKLNIGTPIQEIKALIDPNSDCFKFKKEKSDNYFTDNYRYFPKNSSAFGKTKNPVFFSPFYEIFYDNFNFLGKEKNYKLEFLLDNYTKLLNNTYLPVIGLNIPLIYFGIICPNLIMELKDGNITNNIIWSLKIDNRFEGKLIVGDELSVYDPVKYPISNYSKIYLKPKYTIDFDAVYITDSWDTKINSKYSYQIKLNVTEAFLNINFGLIIGTSEYKKYIDEKIFNDLIKKSFCKIDVINYFSKNDNDKKFNDDYYVYSCYDKFFTGEINMRHPSTNYYRYFPNLLFSSKMNEYNFQLTNKELFEHVSDRYYFAVIFKKNIDVNEKEIWYLGEPFYKKYTFSINTDSKTIGFYLEKNKNLIIENQNNNENNITNNANDKNLINNNQNKNKIFKLFIEAIIIIFLIVLAYYIGLTVRERRKKRANELKDDNYEYLSEKEKNINASTNDSNRHKLVELNSRLGL